MPTSDAQLRANEKYSKANFEYFTVKARKGTRLAIKEFAAARGESLNGFINRAIAETMEREKDDSGEQP